MKALANMLGLVMLFFLAACGGPVPAAPQPVAAPEPKPIPDWPYDSNLAAVLFGFGDSGVFQVKTGQTYEMYVPDNARAGYRQIFNLWVPLMTGYDRDPVIKGPGLKRLAGLNRSYFVWEPPAGRRLHDIDLTIDARKEHYAVRIKFLSCGIFDEKDPRCKPQQSPTPRLFGIGSYGLFEFVPNKGRSVELLKEPAPHEQLTLVVWPPVHDSIGLSSPNGDIFLKVHPDEPSLLILDPPADRSGQHPVRIEVQDSTFILLLRPRL